MIPFPFNENRFFFFVADHLLVGPLCTNPKSDRSLLSGVKVTQCSTSKIGDAPLYNSCTDPTYDNRTIASTLKMQIRTVQRLRAQLNASDDPLEVVERKPKAEDTTRKTRTKEFIEKVQAIINETPQRPIRQIARDLGVSNTTVNACVKDLKCRSYRRQTSQILTEKTKNLRLIKSVRLLNKASRETKPALVIFRRKMVFGVVSSESHIMPPHIFEVGLKVNTKVYLDVLKRVVIPWCNQVAGGIKVNIMYFL